MSDVDALIQMCLAAPSDATRRGALADWCDENSEPEIGAALRPTVRFVEERHAAMTTFRENGGVLYV